MEQTVFDEPTLAEAVGLKHVIEDGLAIIEGRTLSEAKKFRGSGSQRADQ
jgi:hypothetical protein